MSTFCLEFHQPNFFQASREPNFFGNLPNSNFTSSLHRDGCRSVVSMENLHQLRLSSVACSKAGRLKLAHPFI